MLPRKVQVKLYATSRQDSSLESYIPTFHRWIKDSLCDELMIDVADYGHVPHGPGVVLVGHGSDYSIDEGEGRPGLLYFRKRALSEGAELVSDALLRVLSAAQRLDEDPEVLGPKSFGTREILFTFPDRLAVQNDEPGLEKVRPLLDKALAEKFSGVSYQLTRTGDSRAPLTVRAEA